MNPKKKTPRPPTGLSREGRRWWKSITAAWELDEAALLILGEAMRALMRVRQAQAEIDRDGITTKDRYGILKPHPATCTEAAAKATLLRYLKALNLDIEPLNAGPGRPSGR
jgi:hypothetical protein